jgi:hypothetical protein
MNFTQKKISKKTLGVMGIIMICVLAVVIIVLTASTRSNSNTPDEAVSTADSIATTIAVETSEPVTTCIETTATPTTKIVETEPVVEVAATEEVIVEYAEPDIVEEPKEDSVSSNYGNSSWDGEVLNAFNGVVYGPSGRETYYNLDMSGVISIMRSMGNTDEYWIREDGCKMLGDYIMCAANLDVRPRGSLVESSLGTCIVCDTGGFAYSDPYQLDIAVNW